MTNVLSSVMRCCRSPHFERVLQRCKVGLKHRAVVEALILRGYYNIKGAIFILPCVVEALILRGHYNALETQGNLKQMKKIKTILEKIVSILCWPIGLIFVILFYIYMVIVPLLHI